MEPKAFIPTVKKAGGDTAAEQTQSFMKSTNQEAWYRLNYSDEDVCDLLSDLATTADIATDTRSIRGLQRAALPP